MHHCICVSHALAAKSSCTAYFIAFLYWQFFFVDCDVVVQTDTSISRVHAEIVLDKMISQDPSGSMISSGFSGVRIIDRSKFGTVVNKELGADATRLKKNQEAMLKDGNFVTFGTGSATFR